MPHASPHSSPDYPSNRTLLAWTLACFACLIAWDASGKDLAMAQLFGSEAGFPLREQWFFVHVMHEGARRLGWVVVLLLALGVWRGRRTAGFWSAVLALFWFSHGVMVAWSRPPERGFALVALTLAVVVVFAASLPGLQSRFAGKRKA